MIKANDLDYYSGISRSDRANNLISFEQERKITPFLALNSPFEGQKEGS